MINSKIYQNSKGLTLLEVLLSITLLGILFISVLSFFNQAYSYTKKNEDKTVGINVARNVLHYMEQQEFRLIYNQYIAALVPPNSVELTVSNCEDKTTSSPEKNIFESDVCKGFFSSRINNQEFTTKTILKKHEDPKLQDYVIPVEVTVSWGEQTATVRGLIKNE